MRLYIWRHPKPIAAAGRCFGQTNMAVDKRKIKRLAHQIERYAKMHDLPKVIWVSPLQRSRLVGEVLAERGFTYHIAPDLTEIDFGAWENRPWAHIPKQEIDDWCDNFAYFAPEGGESLQQFFKRVRSFFASHNADTPILAIGHAGWINAATLIAAGQDAPKVAADWPRSVGYGALSIISI